MTNLTCWRGARRLFGGLNAVVPAGTVLVVRGGNGSGKSTLLRMLCGLLTPDEGMVRWRGRPVGELRESLGQDVLYLGHLNGLNGDLTGTEEVQLTEALGGDRLTRAEACAALDAAGLHRAAQDVPIRMLSQGQRRRVALARIWRASRPLWILDEPFASLDEAAVQRVTKRVGEHASAGGIVVMAVHEDLRLDQARLVQMRLEA